MTALRQQVLDYIESHAVMTLATAGPAGPWAAAVFYASDGFRLVFLSAASTRHAQELKQQPRVAATIQDQERGWSRIRGVQLEGAARILKGDRLHAAIERYTTKFPMVSADADAPIAAALRRVDWYELVPSHLYFIDNSRGLGHRDEVPLDPA